MIDNLTFLLYTHYEYEDILKFYLYHHQKYIPYIEITICSNRSDYIIEKYQHKYPITKIIEYKDEDKFPVRLKKVLEQVTTEYVLFNQEINVLFDKVSSTFLSSTMDYIIKNNVDQMRLMVSGITNPILSDTDIYQKISDGYFMSVASAIWKKDSFFKIMTTFQHLNYREIECDEVQHYVRSSLNNKYVCSVKQITQINGIYGNHYPVYHIVTFGRLIIFEEYSEYIEKIYHELDIDITKRQIVRYP